MRKITRSLLGSNTTETTETTETTVTTVTTETTVIPTTSTTTRKHDVVHFCINGVYDPAMQFCHCPSGFSGRHCDKFDRENKNLFF